MSFVKSKSRNLTSQVAFAAPASSKIAFAKRRSLSHKIGTAFATALLMTGLLTSLIHIDAAEAATEKDGLIFHDIRLMAADLTDELVYSWIKEPPFTAEHTVVLADVSAPASVDQRFNTLVENRLFDLLHANNKIPIVLAHCSACLQYAAVSNPKQTTIARVIDQPEVLSGALKLTPNQNGLSLHFEATGRELILRAEIFELAPPQKILWAKTFRGSMDNREALRETSPLISLDEARRRQDALLHGHDMLSTFTRFEIRNFAGNSDSAASAIAPVIFLTQSLEATLLPRRDKKFALEAGFTSIKNSLQGWSIGGHYSQLINHPEPSLVNPDVYLFAGATYMSLTGPGAAPFAADTLDVRKIVNAQDDPIAGMTLFRVGVEALVKYRFGIDFYLEYAPILAHSEIIKTQQLLFIPYHDLGLSLVVQW